MERKLVTIQQIDKLSPIEGADAIETAHIKGWKVVVKKGEFKEGDYCLYFEIDSFLPIEPQYEFLRKSCYRKMKDGSEGFRIKTVKLRGQISQGLALPLINPDNLMNLAESIDFDLTESMNVKKYEPHSKCSGQPNAKGNFPSFIRKTDQERVQNIWNKLKKYHNDTWFEVSTKIDGTSATFFYKEGEIGVCSLNLELKINEEDFLVDVNSNQRTKFSYLKTGVNCGVFKALQKYGRNIAIQGELYGEGIQGNNEGIIGQNLAIFDIWDIDNQCYLEPEIRLNLLKSLDLGDFSIVDYPSLDYKVQLNQFETIDDILAFAEGKNTAGNEREGLVFKSLQKINGEVLSFKVISNKFLLAEK